MIIDRVSPGIPFRRARMKNEAPGGTIVINNTIRPGAEDNMFYGPPASRIGAPHLNSALQATPAPHIAPVMYR